MFAFQFAKVFGLKACCMVGWLNFCNTPCLNFLSNTPLHLTKFSGVEWNWFEIQIEIPGGVRKIMSAFCMVGRQDFSNTPSAEILKQTWAVLGFE